MSKGTVVAIEIMDDDKFMFRMQPQLLAPSAAEVGAFGVMISDLIDQIAHAYAGNRPPVEASLRRSIMKILAAENAAKDADPDRRENHGGWAANVN